MVNVLCLLRPQHQSGGKRRYGSTLTAKPEPTFQQGHRGAGIND
jgi:hypothetical protein